MARLIDTSVIIDLERRRHPAERISVLAAGEPLALASITANELLSGVERADTLEHRQHRLTFVEAVLRIVPVLPFDLQVAREHARLDAQLRTVGQLIGANDLLIAATALTHEMSVLTENLRTSSECLV
jgi:tRNA(fMet)-specific endonuclease VapC